MQERYNEINTTTDVLKERYILGAELVGKYDFPMLAKVNGSVDGLEPVVFTEMQKCKHPRQSLGHFFVNDECFDRVWNNAEKYVDMLSNFKWVCSPDFTCYGGMPLALRVFQTYKARALAYYLWSRGVNIIPTVGWNDPESWEWCFDGIPKGSIVAVSTNGIVGKESIEHYCTGYKVMLDHVEPSKVVCVGRPLDVSQEVDIIYFDSYSMQMRKRIANGKSRLSEEEKG